MARTSLFVGITLIALASMDAPMCGQQNEAAPKTLQSVKSTMRKVYEEDQENRSDAAGDAKRRAEVKQLISKGAVQSAEDYYYAAFIFQHGQKPSDYLYAHILAVTAVDKGLHNAIWLSAATLDRYLHSIQQSQVFGTQFGNSHGNQDDQEPYDRELLSDALRAQWCVASESTQAQILSDTIAGKGFRSTRTCPLPDAQFDSK